MNATKLMTFCTVLAAAACYGYISNEIDWKSNAADGNLASAANWSNVPTGVTDIGYDFTADQGYWGKFALGNVTLNLSISAPFSFDRLYFQGTGARYSIDLGGNTLALRGAATHELVANISYINQKILLKNGALDLTHSSRRQFNIQGSGNALTIAGEESSPFVIKGSGLQLVPSAAGIVFSNVVAGTLLQLSGGRVVLTGAKTEIRNHANGYAGMTSGGSAELRIENGALFDAINSNGGLKTDISVGASGSGRNTLVIAGEGTRLIATNSTRAVSSAGDAALVVGHQTNSNRLHVTDYASVTLKSKLLIGNPQQDVTRASASFNQIRIDSNAVVSASDIIIGQRSARSGVTGEATFISNTCVIADSARVTLNNNGLKVGSEYDVYHSAITITNKAYVSTSLNTIGTAGVSNRLEVLDNGVLYCAGDFSKGFRLGGVASTGTVFNVDAGIVAATNALFKMQGSAAGSTTLLRIADGADVCARFFVPTNAGNRIEIDGGKLIVRTQGRFPASDASTVELAFAGARPQLSYKGEETSSTYPAVFSFSAGCSLSFDIPAGGYAEAPITSAAGITVSGLASATIDVPAFFAAGGEEQVLMEAGTGTITIDDASLAKFRAAAAVAGGKVKLSNDRKKLTFSVSKGLLLLFR